MSDDREREISRPSLADAIDLLDLVRSSEDGARLSTESAKPLTPAMKEVTKEVKETASMPPPVSSTRSVPPPIPPAPAPQEEFVDVGDEAIDVAPSLPPTKLGRAADGDRLSASKVTPRPAPVTPPAAKVVPAPPPTAAMPPVVGIILLLGLAIGGLYAILSLPSDAKPPAPRSRPAATAASPTETTRPPSSSGEELRTEPANLELERRPE